MGVPLPLHLRDALREFERHVVHLRVVRVWREAQQVWLSEQARLAAQVGSQRGLVSLAVKLAARVRWAQRWATIACKACHRCFLGEVSGAVGPRRPLPEGLRAVIGARAGLGDCAAAMVRAHRHGTARLGLLVAHLLDQSWDGRGLKVSPPDSAGSRAEGLNEAQSETAPWRRGG